MTRTRRILAGLALLAGCTPPSAGTFGADYEAALCEWATRCDVFETRQQCRDSLVWDTIGRFEYLADAVAAGRVTFDADAAEACLDAVRGLGCASEDLSPVLFNAGFAAAPTSCRDVYVGEVRNYDPCYSSEECAGGDPVCGLPPGCAEMCCVGACRDRAAGLPGRGEACTGTCEADDYCAFDPNTGAPTVCTARRKAGSDCVDDFNSCAEGLDCVWDDNGGGASCTARLGAGELCDFGRCADGLDCYRLNDERRCRTLPDEGEACDASGNYPACGRVDNTCQNDRCVKMPGPGEACPNYECVPWAECQNNGNGSTCRARPGIGEACGASAQWADCLGHLRCGDADRCVEPEPEPVCEVPG